MELDEVYLFELSRMCSSERRVSQRAVSVTSVLTHLEMLFDEFKFGDVMPQIMPRDAVPFFLVVLG